MIYIILSILIVITFTIASTDWFRNVIKRKFLDYNRDTKGRYISTKKKTTRVHKRASKKRTGYHKVTINNFVSDEPAFFYLKNK